MKNYKKVTNTIDSIFNFLMRRNDTLHVNTEKELRRIHRHMRRYWRLYWYILGKIFAIAMVVFGIHCVVAHYNRVLPFGIVSENMNCLWFIWSYAGPLIGAGLVVCGIMKLFEHTINKWLKNL